MRAVENAVNENKQDNDEAGQTEPRMLMTDEQKTEKWRRTSYKPEVKKYKLPGRLKDCSVKIKNKV